MQQLFLVEHRDSAEHVPRGAADAGDDDRLIGVRMRLLCIAGSWRRRIGAASGGARIGGCWLTVCGNEGKRGNGCREQPKSKLHDVPNGKEFGAPREDDTLSQDERSVKWVLRSMKRI